MVDELIDGNAAEMAVAVELAGEVLVDVWGSLLHAPLDEEGLLEGAQRGMEDGRGMRSARTSLTVSWQLTPWRGSRTVTIQARS